MTTAPSPPRRQARLAESVLLTTSPAARARAIDHPKGQPAAAARWWRRRQPADANPGEKAATGAMRPYQPLGVPLTRAGTHPQSLHPKSGPADHSVPAGPESTPPTSTAEPPHGGQDRTQWTESMTGMGRLGDEAAARASMRRLPELPRETASEPGAAGGDEGRASTAGCGTEPTTGPDGAAGRARQRRRCAASGMPEPSSPNSLICRNSSAVGWCGAQGPPAGRDRCRRCCGQALRCPTGWPT